MNKVQKSILIIISCILLLVIGEIIYVKIISSKTSNKNIVSESINQGNKNESIKKNEAKELLKNFNDLKEDITKHIEMEQEGKDNIIYNYNGDLNKFKNKLDKVYINPFKKNGVFELIHENNSEKIKIHLPKNCKLKQVDLNSEISKGNKNESTILIGIYEYVVIKDKDNNWKFPVPIPICEE